MRHATLHRELANVTTLNRERLIREI